MEQEQIYSKKEFREIVIRYLKDKTQIREFNFIINMLCCFCNIKKNVPYFSEGTINIIKSNIDTIGSKKLLEMEKSFLNEVNYQVKKKYEEDNRPYSIKLNIKIKGSKWWSERRAYKHYKKILQILKGRNIEFNNVEFSFKKLNLFYEYYPKDNQEDLIEECILNHKDYTYKQIAETVGCSIDRVKQIAPKVFKTYTL